MPIAFAALAAAMILFAGCATGDYKPCPPLVDYEPAFSARLADEVAALNGDSALVAALSDYYVLRRMVARCGT